MRNLNLHEYQSANIMREHGVNTPKGGVAFTAEEAEKEAAKLGSDNMVIKAQVNDRGNGHHVLLNVRKESWMAVGC